MKSLIESVKPILINPVNPVYVLPGFLRACFVWLRGKIISI